MAIVSRIATIRISEDAFPASNWRQWQATATVQDTAAGGSVSITVAHSTNGLNACLAADTVELRLVTDAGTNIVTQSFGNTGGSFTFHFTDTGATGGVARAGTVEIVLRAQNTTGLAAQQYNVESDGSPNTEPTGHGSTTLDRGWIRGTTTLTEAISNVSLGGAKNSPASYNESLFVRLTSGAVSYVARALAVAVSDTTPPLSQNTNSTTAAQRDVTFSNVVDDRFPVGATTIGVTVTVPNATLTGSPDWTHTSTTDDTLSVDPRITFSHILQIDNNTYSTPPTSNTSINSNGQRLATTLGFLASRAVDSRGAGVNGLTVDIKLWDANNLVYATDRVLSSGAPTATKGGEDGWTDISGSAEFATWNDSLPGGNWNYKITITTADATGLELSNTRTLTLLSADPRIAIIAGGGNPNEKKDHFQAGDTLRVGAAAMRSDIQQLLMPAAVKVAIVRLQDTGANIGRGEYLDSNGTTWVRADNASSIHFFTASETIPGSSKVFIKDFTTTSGWGNYDLFVIAKVTISGIEYSASSQVESVGTANPHDSNQFDPTELFK